MDRRLCTIMEIDVCETTHVLHFDSNIDESIEGQGELRPRNFEGNCIGRDSEIAKPSSKNDVEDDTQTSTHVRFSI